MVDDRADADAMARWARTAKAGGAQVWLQLSHPGRQVPKSLSRRPVAPSAVRLRYPPGLFGGLDETESTAAGGGAYFAEFARAVRAKARMPVMLTGGIRYATTITRLVSEHAVDVVGLARAMALVPDLAARLLGEQAVPAPGWAPVLGAGTVDISREESPG